MENQVPTELAKATTNLGHSGPSIFCDSLETFTFERPWTSGGNFTNHHGVSNSDYHTRPFWTPMKKDFCDSQAINFSLLGQALDFWE